MQKLGKASLYVLFWVILFIVIAEITLRFDPSLKSYPERQGAAFESAYEDTGFTDSWILDHDEDYKLLELAEYSSRYYINEIGVRGETHPVHKPDGELRIIGLGDSFTEGMGAPFDSTWPQLLEKDLNSGASSGNIRVIAGGVGGSDPLFSYQLLKHRLLDYDPDIVLVAINNTDISDIMYRGGFERFKADGSVEFNQAPKIETLFKYSYLVRYVMLKLLNYDWFYNPPEVRKSKEARAMIQLTDAVKKIGLLRDSTMSDFEVVVVFHPLKFELSGGIYNSSFDAIADSFKKFGVESINLMPYMKKELAELPGVEVGDIYWEKDMHHNPLGYYIFAEAVEKGLLDLGMLDGWVEPEPEPELEMMDLKTTRPFKKDTTPKPKPKKFRGAGGFIIKDS